MNHFNYRSFFLVLCPLIGYLGFVFFLSNLQQTPNVISVRHLDKLIHFVLYLPMAILFFRFLRESQYDLVRNYFWIHGIVLSLIYAASDEWHQSFVPIRHMDFYDWLADAAGIFMGALLYFMYLKWKREYENS